MIGPKICAMICDLKFRNKAIIPSSGYTCGLDQYCQLTLFKLFTKSCFSIDSFKTKIYISITIVCKTVGIKTLSKINQVKSMDGWEEKRNFSSYLKLKKILVHPEILFAEKIRFIFLLQRSKLSNITDIIPITLLHL